MNELRADLEYPRFSKERRLRTLRWKETKDNQEVVKPKIHKQY